MLTSQFPAVHCQRLQTPPDLLACAAAQPAVFPALLQSSGSEGWDILFALPQQIHRYHPGESSRLLADLSALSICPAPLPDDPFLADLPFTGGWFFYMAYEGLEMFEPSVPVRQAGEAFPLALLARIPAAVVHQRAQGVSWLVAETAAQLDALVAAIDGQAAWLPQPVRLAELSEDGPEAFLQGVQRCKTYIRDGDVFQVNLSRAWQARMAADFRAADLYARLRSVNPAPFSAWAQLGTGQSIISSSPERLLRIGRNGRIETTPIAGTHARLPDPQEDAQQKQRLLASTKERAEHIMLIDLERNDLGRIAVPGSVEVDSLMDVRSYAFVHHIESTISARLRPRLTLADVLRACFPGGTITGCPKVRTMQIIRELEDQPRRAYTGSLGYINHDGSMDLNILIRTLLQAGGDIGFRAGAGIVADSDPERELAETRSKARGLLRALEGD